VNGGIIKQWNTCKAGQWRIVEQTTETLVSTLMPKMVSRSDLDREQEMGLINIVSFLQNSLSKLGKPWLADSGNSKASGPVSTQTIKTNATHWENKPALFFFQKAILRNLLLVRYIFNQQEPNMLSDTA